MNEKYIPKIKREKNNHKNMNMKDKSVRLSSKRDKSQTVQNAISRNVAKSIKKTADPDRPTDVVDYHNLSSSSMSRTWSTITI